MPPTRRTEAGATLLESLVALAILAFGLLGLVGLQAGLQAQADLVRQQGEASRLAQGLLDQARGFMLVQAQAGQTAWADLADLPEQAAADELGPTAYRVQRNVRDAAWPGVKAIEQVVSWQGRLGAAQRLALQGASAAVPPALSGALLRDATGWPMPRLAGRHGAIPPAARRLGQGRSMFQPAPGVAWVFDDASGDVVGVCDGLPSTAAPDDAALAGCLRPLRAQWLAGHLRMALPEGGPGFDLLLSLAARDPATPAASCVTEAVADGVPAAADSGEPAGAAASWLRYHCLIPRHDAPRWSGRLGLQPRAAATAAPRLCRIGTGGAGGQSATDARTDADLHAASAADFIDVSDALTHQNFLVLPADQACPAVPA